MCGFAGVVAWDERYRTSRQSLARMSAAIAHRGPDGEGTFFNHENEITADRPQCALAFRRLAILDPDPRSNQPFTIDNKTLVFNGEIYNFRELRTELSSLRPDYSWRTSGDTEVLLMSYEVWAEKCVEHFNGMFAFAVWNDAAKSLYLARDRMGQKPLYYTLGKNRIAFASEISALRCVSFWDEVSNVSESSLVDYLNVGYVGGDCSIYGGVRNLLPSTWLKGHQHQYFDRSQSAAVDAGGERTKDLVRTAVQRQLISDVPMGVFLSGGIDSSIVAACAARHGPVQTFSIGFDDPRYNETAFARRVADHLGTQHHAFHVRPDAASALPEISKSFGEPMADSSAIPMHYLARETRAHVKVALSGDGGDELFGGYERYRALAISEKMNRLPAHVSRGISKLGQTLPMSHPKSRLSKLNRLLRTVALPANERYASYMELFDRPLIDALLGRPVNGEQWAADHEWLSMDFASAQLHYKLDSVQTAALIDRTGYLVNDLLTKVDRCSMLHGLEVRSPFMDHELVQFAAGLTTDQLIKGGPKRMLREAFAADLPDFVFKRKKMGFAVPIGDWFRGELRSMLRDHLFAADSFASQHFNRAVVERLVEEHEQERVDHSQRLYALLMLELWWKTSKE